MRYNSLYLYGIIDGKVNKTLQATGIGGRGDTVYCVHYKDVTAVVSDTPFEEYDPTEDNTIAHEKVIQEILREGCSIAPMRFCTIMKRRDELISLCQSCYLPFKKNILRIRGKHEYAVKVFLDVKKLRTQVNNDDELLTTSQNMATQLYDSLKKIVVDHVLEEQMVREMILNASFLVHKDTVPVFYKTIEDFDIQYTDVLKIRISGPTAPYNFVDMPTKPM